MTVSTCSDSLPSGLSPAQLAEELSRYLADSCRGDAQVDSFAGLRDVLADDFTGWLILTPEWAYLALESYAGVDVLDVEEVDQGGDVASRRVAERQAADALIRRWNVDKWLSPTTWDWREQLPVLDGDGGDEPKRWRAGYYLPEWLSGSGDQWPRLVWDDAEHPPRPEQVFAYGGGGVEYLAGEEVEPTDDEHLLPGQWYYVPESEGD